MRHQYMTRRIFLVFYQYLIRMQLKDQSYTKAGYLQNMVEGSRVFWM